MCEDLREVSGNLYGIYGNLWGTAGDPSTSISDISTRDIDIYEKYKRISLIRMINISTEIFDMYHLIFVNSVTIAEMSVTI